MMWIVTGGLGFIGSHFVRYALRKGIEVVNVDLQTYAGNPKNLLDIESMSGYSYIRADIANDVTMNDIFEKQPKINLIVNFAAESHVDRSLLYPGIFVKTNIEGTRVLLDIARKYNCRFLQVSTDEVYGSLRENDTPFNEQSPICPTSPYSASKASADLLALAYFKSYDLDVRVTRCSNNFGPFQFPEKLIPHSIITALKGKKIGIYGNGKNIRDWLFVEDHCAAIDYVISHGSSGEVYNIGGNNEKNNIEIVEIILDELGLPNDGYKFIKDRQGHDLRYAINAEKLKKLGWKPKANFEKELRRTIRWYVENRSVWEDILLHADAK